MGLFGTSGDRSDHLALEARVARLESQVAALTAALSQTSAGGDAVVAPAALDHPEARLLARQGKKIVAIKRVREDTGLGLKEAKELVESWD